MITNGNKDDENDEENNSDISEIKDDEDDADDEDDDSDEIYKTQYFVSFDGNSSCTFCPTFNVRVIWSIFAANSRKTCIFLKLL